MKKLHVFVGLVCMAGLFSCTPEQVVKPGTSQRVKENSIKEAAPQEIQSLDVLLTELPLLKFPLTIDVENYRAQKRVPVAMDKDAKWFAASMQFEPGTKVSAVGRFYVTMKTVAVLYYASFDGTATEQFSQEELIVSIYNTETGTVDSKQLAVSSEGMTGITKMKTPEEAKKVMTFETDDIEVNTQSFDITDKFVLVKSKSEHFPLNEIGRAKSEQLLKSWIK